MIRSLGHGRKVTGHVMDQVLILVAEDAGKWSLYTDRVDSFAQKKQINGVIQNDLFFSITQFQSLPAANLGK